MKGVPFRDYLSVLVIIIQQSFTPTVAAAAIFSRWCISRHGEFLPHPYDCTKFLRCSHDSVYVFQCSASLRWNQTLRTCDFAERTLCVDITGTRSEEVIKKAVKRETHEENGNYATKEFNKSVDKEFQKREGSLVNTTQSAKMQAVNCTKNWLTNVNLTELSETEERQTLTTAGYSLEGSKTDFHINLSGNTTDSKLPEEALELTEIAVGQTPSMSSTIATFFSHTTSRNLTTSESPDDSTSYVKLNETTLTEVGMTILKASETEEFTALSEDDAHLKEHDNDILETTTTENPGTTTLNPSDVEKMLENFEDLDNLVESTTESLAANHNSLSEGDTNLTETTTSDNTNYSINNAELTEIDRTILKPFGSGEHLENLGLKTTAESLTADYTTLSERQTDLTETTTAANPHSTNYVELTETILTEIDRTTLRPSGTGEVLENNDLKDLENLDEATTESLTAEFTTLTELVEPTTIDNTVESTNYVKITGMTLTEVDKTTLNPFAFTEFASLSVSDTYLTGPTTTESLADLTTYVELTETILAEIDATTLRHSGNGEHLENGELKNELTDTTLREVGTTTLITTSAEDLTEEFTALSEGDLREHDSDILKPTTTDNPEETTLKHSDTEKLVENFDFKDFDNIDETTAQGLAAEFTIPSETNNGLTETTTSDSPNDSTNYVELTETLLTEIDRTTLRHSETGEYLQNYDLKTTTESFAAGFTTLSERDTDLTEPATTESPDDSTNYVELTESTLTEDGRTIFKASDTEELNSLSADDTHLIEHDTDILKLTINYDPGHSTNYVELTEVSTTTLSPSGTEELTALSEGNTLLEHDTDVLESKDFDETTTEDLTIEITNFSEHGADLPEPTTTENPNDSKNYFKLTEIDRTTFKASDTEEFTSLSADDTHLIENDTGILKSTINYDPGHSTNYVKLTESTLTEVSTTTLSPSGTEELTALSEGNTLLEHDTDVLESTATDEPGHSTNYVELTEIDRTTLRTSGTGEYLESVYLKDFDETTTEDLTIEITNFSEHGADLTDSVKVGSTTTENPNDSTNYFKLTEIDRTTLSNYGTRENLENIDFETTTESLANGFTTPSDTDLTEPKPDDSTNYVNLIESSLSDGDRSTLKPSAEHSETKQEMIVPTVVGTETIDIISKGLTEEEEDVSPQFLSSTVLPAFSSHPGNAATKFSIDLNEVKSERVPPTSTDYTTLTILHSSDDSVDNLENIEQTISENFLTGNTIISTIDDVESVILTTRHSSIIAENDFPQLSTTKPLVQKDLTTNFQHYATTDILTTTYSSNVAENVLPQLSTTKHIFQNNLTTNFEHYVTTEKSAAEFPLKSAADKIDTKLITTTANNMETTTGTEQITATSLTEIDSSSDSVENWTNMEKITTENSLADNSQNDVTFTTTDNLTVRPLTEINISSDSVENLTNIEKSTMENSLTETTLISMSDDDSQNNATFTTTSANLVDGDFPELSTLQTSHELITDLFTEVGAVKSTNVKSESTNLSSSTSEESSETTTSVTEPPTLTETVMNSNDSVKNLKNVITVLFTNTVTEAVGVKSTDVKRESTSIFISTSDESFETTASVTETPTLTETVMNSNDSVENLKNVITDLFTNTVTEANDVKSASTNILSSTSEEYFETTTSVTETPAETLMNSNDSVEQLKIFQTTTTPENHLAESSGNSTVYNDEKLKTITSDSLDLLEDNNLSAETFTMDDSLSEFAVNQTTVDILSQEHFQTTTEVITKDQVVTEINANEGNLYSKDSEERPDVLSALMTSKTEPNKFEFMLTTIPTINVYSEDGGAAPVDLYENPPFDYPATTIDPRLPFRSPACQGDNNRRQFQGGKCYQYYQCFAGWAFLLNCHEGHFFDPQVGSCVEDYKMKCKE